MPGLIVHLKKPKLGPLPSLALTPLLRSKVFFDIDPVDDFWQTYLMLPASCIALGRTVFCAVLIYHSDTQLSRVTICDGIRKQRERGHLSAGISCNLTTLFCMEPHTKI